MLLAIDIGNTNTVIGVYSGDVLMHHWRIQTDRRATSDELGILYQQLFMMSGLSLHEVHGVIIACVVPPIEWAVMRMVKDLFHLDAAMVGQTIFPDMPVLYEEHHLLGADRLVNAVAAWEQYRSALVIVDFGTATTFDAVTQDGAYLGGAIAPGITISSEALFQAASKLPRVEFAKPEHVIGRRTDQAIQSGMLYGYVGLVKELVERIRAELEGEVTVVATGGLAEFVASETDIIDYVDPLLTLVGLRLIWERSPLPLARSAATAGEQAEGRGGKLLSTRLDSCGGGERGDIESKLST